LGAPSTTYQLVELELNRQAITSHGGGVCGKALGT
jgi:hypothetical protein